MRKKEGGVEGEREQERKDKEGERGEVESEQKKFKGTVEKARKYDIYCKKEERRRKAMEGIRGQRNG